MSRASIVIHPVSRDERAAWEPLWKGYLDFYRLSVAKEVYDTTWARLHDPDEPMFVLGAQPARVMLQGNVAGYDTTAGTWYGYSASTKACRWFYVDK